MAEYKFNKRKAFARSVVWRESNSVVTANNYYSLCQGVHSLRMSSGGDLRPGWEDRLMSAVCKEYKLSGCSEASLNVRTIGLSDIASFYTAMKHWKALDGKLVSENQSEARASVCVSCEENKPIIGCFGCTNVLPAVLEMVKGAATSKDEQLKGCGVCGCALKAKVHMPVEVMQNSNPDDFPDHCWIKSELEEALS